MHGSAMKNDSPKTGLVLQLTAVALLMLVGMAIYECVKQVLFPGITMWESHIVTVVFSAVCATVAAYFVLKRHIESEERYRTAIEHSTDGVVMIHDEGYLYVNQRFLDMFGYGSSEEIIGSPLASTIHPDDRERVAEIYRKRQRDEAVPSRYEFKGIRKDGREVFVEISVAGITYNNEKVSLGYMRDVTDRKKIEEERLYSAKLESALEVAGTVCHELNQPLQIISGYSDLLIMGNAEGPSAAEKLETIKKQALRMGSITKRLMGFRQYTTREYVGTTKIIDINAK